MSVKITTKVWEWSESTGTARLVMLALADFCDDDGVCCPGIKRVAAKVKTSERSVQRIISDLIEMGEIERIIGAGLRVPNAIGGDGFTNAYRLKLRGVRNVTPPQRGVTNGAEVTETRGDTAMSPKPSVKPSVQHSELSLGGDGGETEKDEVTEVFKHWNIIPGVTRANILSEKRAEAIKLRLKNKHFRAHWREAMSRVSFSDWCKGKNDRNWKASLEWFLQKGKVEQIMDWEQQQPAAPKAAVDAEYPEFISKHPIESIRKDFPTFQHIPKGDHYLRSEFYRWLKNGHQYE